MKSQTSAKHDIIVSGQAIHTKAQETFIKKLRIKIILFY